MTEEPKESRTEYADRMAEWMRQWETDIRDLQAKAEKAGADGRADIRRHIAELERQRDHAMVELNHLRKSSEDAWGEMRKGMEEAGEAMRKAWTQAMSKF